MSKKFDIYIDLGRKRLQYLKKYKDIAKQVKEIVLRFCSNAEIYVFGSVLNGEFTAASDIDILIVCDNLNSEEKYRLTAEIHKHMNFDAPIEVHFATKNEFSKWYSKFLDKYEKI